MQNETLYIELGKITFEKLDALAQAEDADAPELDFFLADGKVLELLNQISAATAEEAPVVPQSEEIPVPIAAPAAEVSAPQIQPAPVIVTQYVPPQPASLQPQRPAVCPKCNAALLPGARFCGSCGTSITETPIQRPVQQPAQNLCPHCGKELRPGAVFCIGCGSRV
jgi:hypothetical protein